jgi:hypothetical protein
VGYHITFVFVSQRTSSCLSLSVSSPVTRLPMIHGTKWPPGLSTSSNFPNCSLMPTVTGSPVQSRKTCRLLQLISPFRCMYQKKEDNVINNNFVVELCIASDCSFDVNYLCNSYKFKKIQNMLEMYFARKKGEIFPYDHRNMSQLGDGNS